MAEITREHLELAALAAGHKIYGWCVLCGDRIAYADIGPEGSVSWRPHLDNGDTARLAALLCMTTEWGNVGVIVGDGGWIRVRHCSSSAIRHHDGTEPDKLRAWREAVTLCAAAVGERMRGER